MTNFNRIRFSEILTILGIIISVIALLSLGWIGNDLYKEYKNERILNGLWLSGFNYSSATERAYSLDNSGQWVLVNVDDSMDYETIIKTCEHEATHEWVARQFTRTGINATELAKLVEEGINKQMVENES